MVAQDVGNRRLLDAAVEGDQVVESLVALGVFGFLLDRKETVQLLRDADGVAHLALGVAGMDVAALDADGSRGGVEVLELQLADLAAVDRIGVVGPEFRHVELHDAPADLLVGREADLDLTVRDIRVLHQVLDRIHDLRDAGLVVSAEQRSTVRRDEGLPLVVQQFRELGGLEIQAGHAPQGDVAAVIVLDDLRLDVGAGSVGRRVHVGDEAQFGRLYARGGGQGAHDIAVFVQRRFDAEGLQFIPQHAQQFQLLVGAGLGLGGLAGLRVVGHISKETVKNLFHIVNL